MPDTKKLHILLAAGGSGGHLFPAMALAEELMKDNHNVCIVTDHRGARFKGDSTPYPIEIINSATLEPGLIGKFKTAFKLGIGVLQSFKLIKSFKPDVVIGFGGYPAFPPVFTAQKLGIKTILHEANAVLGKANKMLAKQATKIALSLPTTLGVHDVSSNKDKAEVTGNPVRSEIIQKQGATYKPFHGEETIRIFIMGGSQGARTFSEIVPEAVALLPEHIQKRLHIIQQCRPEDLDDAQNRYAQTKAQIELESFFNDVPEQFEKCHLFIGRSGASTVSEVAIIGRPAIFVPMYHADMQQKVNADVIADVGGAWVILQDGFTAEALSARLETLFSLPQGLEAAAAKSASVGKPDATKNLAQLVQKIAA